MLFSFNPLWKLLIDKDMTKEKLRVALKISPNTTAKISKGEYVSMEVLHRICEYFDVPVEDMIVYMQKIGKQHQLIIVNYLNTHL